MTEEQNKLAEEIEPFVNCFADETEGAQFEAETWNRLRRLLYKTIAALREPATEALKQKRIEKAYCAANDYINALTGTASIPPESLEKIKAAYWQAVKEVQ